MDTTAGYCANREIRIPAESELPDQEDIQRNQQCLRNLSRYRHAATRKRQQKRVLKINLPAQRFRENSTRVRAVLEWNWPLVGRCG